MQEKTIEDTVSKSGGYSQLIMFVWLYLCGTTQCKGHRGTPAVEQVCSRCPFLLCIQ